MKFVDLDNVVAVVHEVAGLLYALGAEREEIAGIVERNLLLPFETADTIGRRSLDG